MTDSYGSHRRPLKLLLIHGMNNNLEAFFPLRDELLNFGFEVQMVVLPNHGELRDEVKTLREALSLFDKKIQELVQEPYVVVAFSQGALYFQLWLQRFKRRKPEAMVLLAPAVYINYIFLIGRIFKSLPEKFFITSRMPKMFRRYDRLFFWEYRLLVQGTEEFQQQGREPGVPTLVMIDPQDELVNARKVLNFYQRAAKQTISRKILKKGLGQHHIIFHPDYFSGAEWRKFLEDIRKHISPVV